MGCDGSIADLPPEPQKENDEHSHAEDAALDYIKEMIEIEVGFGPVGIEMAASWHTISFRLKEIMSMERLCSRNQYAPAGGRTTAYRELVPRLTHACHSSHHKSTTKIR